MNVLYLEFDPRFFNNDLLFFLNNIKDTYYNESAIMQLSDIEICKCKVNAELHFIRIKVKKEDLKEKYQNDFIE